MWIVNENTFWSNVDIPLLIYSSGDIGLYLENFGRTAGGKQIQKGVFSSSNATIEKGMFDNSLFYKVWDAFVNRSEKQFRDVARVLWLWRAGGGS